MVVVHRSAGVCVWLCEHCVWCVVCTFLHDWHRNVLHARMHQHMILWLTSRPSKIRFCFKHAHINMQTPTTNCTPAPAKHNQYNTMHAGTINKAVCYDQLNQCCPRRRHQEHCKQSNEAGCPENVNAIITVMQEAQLSMAIASVTALSLGETPPFLLATFLSLVVVSHSALRLRSTKGVASPGEIKNMDVLNIATSWSVNCESSNLTCVSRLAHFNESGNANVSCGGTALAFGCIDTHKV